MRSKIEVENRRGRGVCSSRCEYCLDPYVYVTCPNCGECEGQPVGDQRYHLQGFTFVGQGYTATEHDITKMLCNGCDIPFDLTWDYDNIVTESKEDITDKEFITEAFEIAFGDDAINRNFSKREVLEELMGFSKTALLYDDDEEDIPKAAKPTYEVTGVTRQGHRFKVTTGNCVHAMGINLWRGTVWEVVNGKRKKMRTVYN